MNRKGFKSAEKDYQSITDAKEKRGRRIISKGSMKIKKYNVLHLTIRRKTII